jgi:hypothetical protein
VRRVRILGLCTAAVFATCAMTLSLAAPALAKKSPFEKFNECPLGTPELKGCIYGEAGAESYFQAGKVTVHFVKPVILQGGFQRETEERTDPFVAARNGKTIGVEKEPTVGLTEGLDAEKLEEPEKKRYEEYIASGKSTKVTEAVELAAPASDIFLAEENLVAEVGQGFGFPVMIHIQNPFLGKNCYDGTTVEPIDIPYTTGETHPEPPNTPIHGYLGSLESEGEGEILVIKGQKLVNNEYAAPGVSGCGLSGGADAALDEGLGLPSPAGSNTTELVGNLYQASHFAVEEALRF